MLSFGFYSVFALLLWEVKPAAGAVTNTTADIQASAPSNSETLVPTLLSFSLEPDRWPGSPIYISTVFTLTVFWSRLGRK